MSSWLSDLAKRGEAFLENVDQTAAVAATKPLTLPTPVSIISAAAAAAAAPVTLMDDHLPTDSPVAPVHAAPTVANGEDGQESHSTLDSETHPPLSPVTSLPGRTPAASPVKLQSARGGAGGGGAGGGSGGGMFPKVSSFLQLSSSLAQVDSPSATSSAPIANGGKTAPSGFNGDSAAEDSEKALYGTFTISSGPSPNG